MSRDVEAKGKEVPLGSASLASQASQNRTTTLSSSATAPLAAARETAAAGAAAASSANDGVRDVLAAAEDLACASDRNVLAAAASSANQCVSTERCWTKRELDALLARPDWYREWDNKMRRDGIQVNITARKL